MRAAKNLSINSRFFLRAKPRINRPRPPRTDVDDGFALFQRGSFYSLSDGRNYRFNGPRRLFRTQLRIPARRQTASPILRRFLAADTLHTQDFLRHLIHATVPTPQIALCSGRKVSSSIADQSFIDQLLDNFGTHSVDIKTPPAKQTCPSDLSCTAKHSGLTHRQTASPSFLTTAPPQIGQVLGMWKFFPNRSSAPAKLF